MSTSTELFSDIAEALKSRTDIRTCYSRLNDVFLRILSEKSAELSADFSNPYSRVMGVCRHASIDFRYADAFRRNAFLVLHHRPEAPADEQALLLDAARLCHFVRQLFDCPLPEGLAFLPQSAAYAPTYHAAEATAKLRAVVTTMLPDGFRCTSEQGELVVRVPRLERTLRVLTEGAAVNLVDVTFNEEGECTPRLVVLEPDYLVDVSSLTAAMKDYGATAENYLLSMLAPAPETEFILLGNAANDFMDELVNTTADLRDDAAMARLYAEVLARHFAEYRLAYACPPQPLSADFPRRLRQAFENIRASVAKRFGTESIHLSREDVVLEPSFICETLGLRGRFDVMNLDHHSLLELKSGRARELGPSYVRPQAAHVAQMSLYQEILHYNFSMPRRDLRGFLFYSRYPMFYDERLAIDAVTAVLELRNEIVALEGRLREGQAEEVVAALTPERLNAAGLHSFFWERYLEPELKQLCRPLATMPPLEKAYFCAFLTFLEREKFLGKTTDNRPDSTRGLASTWLTDADTKFATGDILPRLRIKETGGDGGTEYVTFDLPDYGADFIANFSMGEMVQCYRCNATGDNVTNQQLIRGYIEHLDVKTLRLRLTYKQRNAKVFPPESLYAVEHDASDAPFSRSVRGLYALLTAPDARRALLLGRRLPEVDEGAPGVLGQYNPAAADIVRRVKQSADYFLLVGPPGTGKTSVALRAMVCEHLLEEKARPTGTGLLLTAYTNRAVDEICGMLENLMAERADLNLDYLRIGVEQTCGADYRPHLVENALADCTTRVAVRERMREIPIVVGTVFTLSAHTEIFRLRPFNAIIDEASQVLEPQLLPLLCARGADGGSGVRRFVMIGDHKQLPAVVLQPEWRTKVTDPLLTAIGLTDLRNSLFQRLHGLQENGGERRVIGMLDHQGRMHPDICRFVNEAFYDRRLFPVPLKHQEGTLDFTAPIGPWERFAASTRMGFVDIRPATPPANNKANAAEAEAVARLVVALEALNRRCGTAFSVAKSVGIIVPFRNQIATVRNALRRRGVEGCEDVTIDTVECYQGSQRDVIIFSTTVSRPYQMDLLSVTCAVGSVDVDRKLNVAVTRARIQFFMVGNEALLSRNAIYRRLIAACTKMPA